MAVRTSATAVFFATASMVCSLLAITVPDYAEAEDAVLGQNVLVDPVRPVIYWAGGNGNDLRFINSSTGDVIDTITLAGGPSSLCLSSDYAVLYVAIPSYNCILTIDTVSRSLTGNISLTIAPFSIRHDGGNFMYISGGTNAAWIYSYDMRTWKMKDSVDPGLFNMWIEVSPDGSTLLAFETGLTPHKICKYGINSGTFTYLDIDNHDLGAFLINEVVDWARGKIYIASGAPYGIEVVSVDTLNNLGMYPMDAYATCVAMSVDGRYVFGVHDGVYAGAIWMFNATDGNFLGNMGIEPGIRNLAIAHDLRSAYVGSPVQRKMLIPSIELLYPSWHNVYGYTPTQFLVRFRSNLGEYDAQNATLEVNGANLSLTPYDTDGHWIYYRTNFNQTLEDGTHNVSISLPWFNQRAWGNSTFTVNRSSPDSLKPTLIANEPVNESIQLNESMTISAHIVHVNSDRPAEGGWILVNGINLTTTFDPEILIADYATPSLGQQNVSAYVYWDDGLGRAWANWTFFVMDGPLMTPIFPAASQVLTELPDHIEVGIDTRDPGGNFSAPQIYLDGSPLLTVLTGNNSMRADVDYTIKGGMHIVQATLDWIGGKASITWEFELDMFVGPRNELLVLYEYKEEFSMLVPNGTSWILEEDAEISGDVFPIVIYGPTIGNFRTNILVQSGRDRSVEESEEYLGEQLDIALEELRESGMEVNLKYVPELREVGNCTAYLATIELVGYGIYQEFAIIVSEEHQRVWVIILSISVVEFNAYSIMFDEMVDSFEVKTKTSSTWSGLEQAAIGLGLAAFAGAVAGAIFWLARRKRGPVGPVQP